MAESKSSKRLHSSPDNFQKKQEREGEENEREKEENGDRKKVDWGRGKREHAVCPKRVGGSKRELVREKERERERERGIRDRDSTDEACFL